MNSVVGLVGDGMCASFTITFPFKSMTHHPPPLPHVPPPATKTYVSLLFIGS
jgi:hypothetical protein